MRIEFGRFGQDGAAGAAAAVAPARGPAGSMRTSPRARSAARTSGATAGAAGRNSDSISVIFAWRLLRRLIAASTVTC